MDGKWTTASPDRQELIRQAGYARGRILLVNTAAQSAIDASGFAALAPNVAPLNVSDDGGPHFISSPETPDGFRVEGFQFALVNSLAAGAAVAGAGGFTVTIWKLIDVLEQQTIGKIWASFDPRTGVNYNELYHSFDVNCEAIRFQISNVAVNGTIPIYFCEI
jgi:hypothetical protein